MKIVKAMKTMKKSVLPRLGAMTSPRGAGEYRNESPGCDGDRTLISVLVGSACGRNGREASPPRDVMAPLPVQVAFMFYMSFMTFMSFLETAVENH